MESTEMKMKIQRVIDHLQKSFNVARDYIDNQDLKMSLSELVVSNAEARELLTKIIEDMGE